MNYDITSHSISCIVPGFLEVAQNQLVLFYEFSNFLEIFAFFVCICSVSITNEGSSLIRHTVKYCL